MKFWIRWAAAFALVTFTYNPTGYSYFEWVTDPETLYEHMPIKFLILATMLIGYAIFIRSIITSLGKWGAATSIGMLGTVAYLAQDYGIVNLANPTSAVWVLIIAASALMATGMTNAFFVRWISGQREVN